MRRREQLRQARRDVIAACAAGLNAADLRPRILGTLSAVLPVDAAFFASADPGSLLFTGATSQNIPADATRRFLHNELGGADVNRFVDLARGPRALDSLDRATAGQREESPRYRDILDPMGLGDELRIAFRSGGTTWGFMCLHRAAGPAGFTADDAAALRAVAPHITDGLRRATIAAAALREGHAWGASPGAGVLVLKMDFSVAATSPAADHWIAAILTTEPTRVAGLPLAVAAVADRVRRIAVGDPEQADWPPTCRVRTEEGWLVLHGAALNSGVGQQVAVVLEPAAPHHLAPLYLEVFALTARESEVARLLLRGCSNTEIAAGLAISAETVQDHVKQVFEKAGVGSRRELMLAIYGVPAE